MPDEAEASRHLVDAMYICTLTEESMQLANETAEDREIRLDDQRCMITN